MMTKYLLGILFVGSVGIAFYAGFAIAATKGSTRPPTASCGCLSTDVTFPHFYRVIIEGQNGYIDRRGTIVIPPQYDAASNRFSEGLAWVRLNEHYGYIGLDGKVAIAPQFDIASDFSGGLAVVSQGGKVGYIDHTGIFVIPPIYDVAEPFCNGVASVGMQTPFSRMEQAIADVGARFSWSLIDRTGQTVDRVGPGCQEMNIVENGGLFGFQSSQTYIAPRFDAVKPFQNGYARVKIGHLWGVIDRTGQLVLNPTYNDIGEVRFGRLAVQIGSKWGIMNIDGSFVVEPRFDWIYEPIDDLWPAAEQGALGYLDGCGAWVWQPTK